MIEYFNRDQRHDSQIHLPNFRCWSRSGTCAECCPVIWALCGERDSPHDGQAALLFHPHDAAIQFHVPPEPRPGKNFPGTKPFHQVPMDQPHRQRSSLGCDLHHINGVWSGEAWLEMPRPRRRMRRDGLPCRLRNSCCHIRKPSGLFGAATHGIFPRSLADPTTPTIEHPKAIIPRHQVRKV